MSKTIKKLNLKEYLDDTTLDLSMNDLDEVPVKEISDISKATTLDLSSNKLTTLSKSFAESLHYLITLDLAQNQLNSLPENFGLLINLKHLDLYKNNLSILPLSFGNLKALRWLDLKENPLMARLAQVAGPCTNSVQCQAAAKNIVKFYKDTLIQIEEEKNRRLALQQQADADKFKKKKEKKKKKKSAKLESDILLQDFNVNNEKITDVGTLDGKTSSKAMLILMFLKLTIKCSLLLVTTFFIFVFLMSLLDDTSYNINKEVFLNYSQKYIPEKIIDTTYEFWQFGKTHFDNFSIYLKKDQNVRFYMNFLKDYWSNFTNLFTENE